MSSKVGIRDVAQKAGVSISTVSRVLNDGGYVSENTKEKVLKVVEQMGYRPNIIARGLRTQKTRSIGLIVPDITNEFFSNIAKAIEDKLNEYNYNLLLCNSDEDKDKERKYIKTLLDKFVDGMIFISSGYDENMDIFPANFPVVAIDRKPNINNLNFISSQNEEGGYIATKHLIECGCRNIIMIKDNKVVSPMLNRLKGYKRALQEYSLEYNENNVMEVEVHLDNVKELILKTHNKFKFDGIFAGADIIAIGVVKTLLRLGYKIPEDIQVVGFDNISATDFYNPGITTIAQPIKEMGNKSAELLIDILENNRLQEKKKSYILPVELIKRNTTK